MQVHLNNHRLRKIKRKETKMQQIKIKTHLLNLVLKILPLLAIIPLHLVAIQFLLLHLHLLHHFTFQA